MATEELYDEDHYEPEEPEELDLTPDERRLVTQPYDLAIRQVAADVKDGKILLIEVPYQREYVWDDGQFQRSVHGSRHDAGACNRPRPLENPGCQEHRCRRAIATRSALR